MCVSMRRMPTGRSGDSLGPSALILHLVRDKVRAVDKISAESGADYTVDLPIILSFDHPDIDLPQAIRPAELIWQGDISKLRRCMQIFYFFWFKCFILYFTCHKCKAEPCVVPPTWQEAVSVVKFKVAVWGGTLWISLQAMFISCLIIKLKVIKKNVLFTIYVTR